MRDLSRRIAPLAALAVAVVARAVVAPTGPVPLRDLDVRGSLDPAKPLEAPPTKAQLAARDVLAADAERASDGRPGELVVRWGWQAGTLHHAFRRGGWLSEAAPAGFDAEAVARALATRHRALAGLSEEGARSLELVRSLVDPTTSARHVSFRQRVDGVPVFHGSLRVHLAADGRLLSLAGDTVDETIRSATTRLSAMDALVAAASSVGVALDAQSSPSGADRREGDAKDEVRFGLGPFESEPWAHLRWFPRGGLVKAWVVVVDPKDDPGWYQVVVDATSGEILARHDLVDFLDTDGLVFREDPGQGPQLSLPFVDDSGRTDPASPEGWTTSGQTEGNNVDSKDDRANDNEATEGSRATASPGPPVSFAFPFTDDPNVDLDAACTNAFYVDNWLHDRMARLGFDEASGNFQQVNYSGAGRGSDRVRIDVQDGGGRNNANFGTPPDGTNPRMQMYIWTYTWPWRDSSYDASVITHEQFHGVSNRLVGLLANDAGCLGGPQGSAMGEAWSDFFACSFWDQDTVGGYLVDNYVRGIRRAPYGGYPYDYGQLCNQGGFESHRDGEIWAGTLWRIRELFAARYGYERGRCVVERLVLDGMKLSPCLPNYVDMRDAILLAARLHGVDGDECLLWQGFAERGLGVGAVPKRDCTSPADASYVVPSECATCGTFTAPAGVVVDTSLPNRVVARFTPSPGATGHLLVRSPEPCPGDCLEASFEEVARGPADATTLEDVDGPGRPLSAGSRFSYRVVALSGACTAMSPCFEVQVAGRCTLRPEPAVAGEIGIAALERPPSAACTVVVSWHPSMAACAPFGSVRYNVYRSEDPAFVPGPESLLASIADPATSYTDGAAPAVSVTYVVRAEDLTTGGDGPHGGNEESNDERLTLSPQGLGTGTTTFSDDAESGELPGYRRTGTFTINDWGIVADPNTRGGSAWHCTDVEGGNADKNIHLPLLSLGSAPRLRFVHTFDVEPDYDGGVAEISVDAGRTWEDLLPHVVTGGYTGRTQTVEDLIHPPNVDQLWTAQNAAGFPNYEPVDVDLAVYANTLDAQIRLRMLIDPNATAPGGWYVDDLVVEDVRTFGACVDACASPPSPAVSDALACTSTLDPVLVRVDASASTPGASGFAAELPIVLTHDGPGSFGGRRWALGPAAVLTFPAGTPAGDYSVTATVRGADTCSGAAVATIRLRDETVTPEPVGDTLRVTKQGPGIRLAWTGVGAAGYNVLVASLGDDLAALDAQPPTTTAAGSPLDLSTGLAALGAGTIFLKVHSASDCGRSVLPP